MKVKTVIIAVVAFAAGFGLHAGWTAITSGPSSVADHWAVVEGFNAYLEDPTNYEFDPQSGLSSMTPPTEPLVSLAFLELAGEIEHLDVVLSGVPQSSLTTRYWKWFLQQRDDIVHAWGHYDSLGEAMVHLNLWFKPSAGDAVEQMMKNLEEVVAGRIVLAGTGFKTRQSDSRLVPTHPNLHRFLGEWEAEGETVFTISTQPDGSITIESEGNSFWDYVINQVRWEGDSLHFDQYMYSLVDDDLVSPESPLGGHPFSGIRIASVLSLTDDPDLLSYTARSVVAVLTLEGELRRVMGGG